MLLGCGCDDRVIAEVRMHYGTCTWAGIDAHQYPGVREWWRWGNGGDKAGVELVVDQARRENAPFDAVYKIHDGRWRTLAEASRVVPTPRHGFRVVTAASGADKASTKERETDGTDARGQAC